MIKRFWDYPREVYSLIQSGSVYDKWVVIGVDMFSYEDYPVAICDTKEEVDIIIEERRVKLNDPYGSINDATWTRAPYAHERHRVL